MKIDIKLKPTGKALYEQIADGIRLAIYEGTLRDGDRLPSVREMSRELDVSSITVKHAYLALKSDRIAYTVSGKGTYIHLDELWHEVKEHELLNGVRRLADELHKLGTAKEKLIDSVHEIYEKE